MDSFTGLMLLGAFILFITLIAANEGLPSTCTEDAKLCPDGSTVGRDALKNCEFFTCPNTELIKYCTSNILTVEESGNNIKTLTSLLGGGFTVYNEFNVTHCPVVSPNYITQECKNYMNTTWNTIINCSTILYHDTVFKCPTNYYTYQDYKWINCNMTDFQTYCNNTNYMQWINANCGIEIINQ